MQRAQFIPLLAVSAICAALGLPQTSAAYSQPSPETRDPSKYQACLELASTKTNAVTIARNTLVISQRAYIDAIKAIQESFETCKNAITDAG